MSRLRPAAVHASPGGGADRPRRRPATRAAIPAQTGQAGEVLVWVAAMLPFFLGVVGLSVDGATVFAARRELQSLADGAAQAAVTRVDTGLYEATGSVALDRAAAVRATEQYLVARRPGVAWTVEPDAQGVVVEIGEEVPLTFLRLLGRQSVYLTARAPAVLRYGIEAAR